uniref:Uncharacterized protein n=1 Tax=Arundo donax TaxID=35708 RepID=A0A0A9BRK1_ARUDO
MLVQELSLLRRADLVTRDFTFCAFNLPKFPIPVLPPLSFLGRSVVLESIAGDGMLASSPSSVPPHTMTLRPVARSTRRYAPGLSMGTFS